MHGLFWILKKNKYIAFRNWKVFMTCFEYSSHLKYLFGSTSLRLFIFLMPYRPLDGVKTITITNTSQTEFISISGYTGPHKCTVGYLCSTYIYGGRLVQSLNIVQSTYIPIKVTSLKKRVVKYLISYTYLYHSIN